MLKLSFDQIDNLSFPDFRVLAVQFNPKKKTLGIKVEGAWLEAKTLKGNELGIGWLRFQSWNHFLLRKYNFHSNEWSSVLEKDFEPIKDICEFQKIEQTIYLRGFGKRSNLWLEYEIISPILEMEFSGKQGGLFNDR